MTWSSRSVGVVALGVPRTSLSLSRTLSSSSPFPLLPICLGVFPSLSLQLPPSFLPSSAPSPSFPEIMSNQHDLTRVGKIFGRQFIPRPPGRIRHIYSELRGLLFVFLFSRATEPRERRSHLDLYSRVLGTPTKPPSHSPGKKARIY